MFRWQDSESSGVCYLTCIQYVGNICLSLLIKAVIDMFVYSLFGVLRQFLLY